MLTNVVGVAADDLANTQARAAVVKTDTVVANADSLLDALTSTQAGPPPPPEKIQSQIGLIGLLFAFVYLAVDDFRDAPFFAQPGPHAQGEFLYFSYVALTTLGFGDLSPSVGLPQALTVLEAAVSLGPQGPALLDRALRSDGRREHRSEWRLPDRARHAPRLLRRRR